MLHLRLILAAVIIFPLVGLMWIDLHWPLFDRPGLLLLPVAVLAAVLGTAEMLSLMGTKNLRPIPWVVYSATVAIVLAAAAPMFWKQDPTHSQLEKIGLPAIALALGAMLAFVGEMRRYQKPGSAIVHLALAILTMVYIGLLMSFVIQLRQLGSSDCGMVALVSLIVVVKLGDTGAYACGRLLGRHKLVPVLSPGKTVRGALGGICTACLGSWIMFTLIAPWVVGEAESGETPWWGWLTYGVLVALAGMVGDLAVSLLKRDMDRKDSSNWLPGLGGVLDVMDSVLMAAPAAYLLWITGLVGP